MIIQNIQQRISRRKLFITGGSGVLGCELSKHLQPHSTIWLRHKRSLDEDTRETIYGDIAADRLGLAERNYRRLANRISSILHGAAVTNFNRPADEILETNVKGTKNIIELARAAGNVPIYYISTAFVEHREEHSGVGETSAYSESKRIAEKLVRESGLPWIIIRPSVIVGNAVNGAIIPYFQGFHSLVACVLKGQLPMLPATPSAMLDFVPQDVAASATAAVINHGQLGNSYWLTAGKSALTIERIVELVKSFAAGRNQSIPPLRLVTPDMMDRLFRPVFLPALPKPLRSRMIHLLHFVHYINVYEPFPSSLPDLQSATGLNLTPDLEDVFLLNMRYWADINHYGRTAQAAATVNANGEQ